ncbi:bifunctional DNA primase/polymerase [Sporosarcina luteola]|uniref:bifunctional DNA primase/polymerase n=1 Tax=Sporosarcina luteola TaxID=582850 RepID=UPI00203BD338|nr:bifunctional DNA primase/polymerase [Sporosarcina luteola]MCM3636378.1 bifunctional DNA primase/polymerase [Sporosarcina luteola]
MINNSNVLDLSKEVNVTNRTDKMLKAALAYVDILRWHVFPVHFLSNNTCSCGRRNCEDIAKHPIPSNGFYSATTDARQIRKWWTKYPLANIGVRTGKESNIFVLDVDIKKDDGRKTLDELIYQFGKLPDTVQSITGSNGLHFVFKYQDGIKNRVNFLPGLDIRGDAGYFMAPPSQHQNGRIYTWELSSHPLKLGIAKAPSWLTQMLIKPKNNNGIVDKHLSSHWQHLLRGLAEGEGRNNAAASISGHLFRRYVDPLLITEIMELWNERNSPPLSHNELYKTINSIAGLEIARRSDIK